MTNDPTLSRTTEAAPYLPRRTASLTFAGGKNQPGLLTNLSGNQAGFLSGNQAGFLAENQAGFLILL